MSGFGQCWMWRILARCRSGGRQASRASRIRHVEAQSHLCRVGLLWASAQRHPTAHLPQLGALRARGPCVKQVIHDPVCVKPSAGWLYTTASCPPRIVPWTRITIPKWVRELSCPASAPQGGPLSWVVPTRWEQPTIGRCLLARRCHSFQRQAGEDWPLPFDSGRWNSAHSCCWGQVRPDSTRSTIVT